jgi:hypothetical protein
MSWKPMCACTSSVVIHRARLSTKSSDRIAMLWFEWFSADVAKRQREQLKDLTMAGFHVELIICCAETAASDDH